MTDRDIERKAISEILKETKILKDREKPPENGFCINKRLLSRNLVSTLRNPVFPKHLQRRRIIGLDDETEDESDTDHSRQRYGCSRNRFADDDYIYDARDYFNPEKYREIVAYRNRKRQIQECYERKRNSADLGDSIYMPDVRKNNYDDDKLQYRKLQDSDSGEHEADVVDEKSRIDVLSLSSTGLCVFENTNSAGTFNHRKRKHHKSKCTHSQQKTHSRKMKHRQDKLDYRQEDKDKKSGKCKKHTTRIRKARHKNKATRKQKRLAYTSDIEFGELNQIEVEDFKELRSDCVGNTSRSDGHFGNEDFGSSMQSSLCYKGSQSNDRLAGDGRFKAEQFVTGYEISYEGSSLVSAKYLNDLYFRTRQNGDSSAHLFG